MSTPALPASRLGRITRGSGPGLLLAHGVGGGIEPNFGPIMDGLAACFTVVGPDYPGIGPTPRANTPLVLDDLADELVAAAVGGGTGLIRRHRVCALLPEGAEQARKSGTNRRTARSGAHR